MPSPFPGMNPYLEQDDVWHDFHERFVPLVATVLGSQLRPRGTPYPRLDGDDAVWAGQFVPNPSS